MPTIQDQLTANQAALNDAVVAINASIAAASNAVKIQSKTVADLSQIGHGTLLVYNATSEQWEPIVVLGDLSGADEGQILRWKATTGRFELATLAEAKLAIGDLTDVDLTGITHGQIIKWNAEAGGFEPGNLTAASAGNYAVIDRIQLVDGSQITISAGITAIQNDVSLLPALTGADSRVTTSSQFSSSYPGWKALDKLSGLYREWISAPEPHAWWKFSFGSPVSIGRILLQQRSYGGSYDLKDFKIQTSQNNGSSWADSLIVSGEPVWGPGEKRNFALGSVVANVTDLRIYNVAGHDPRGYINIEEIEAYSQVAASSGLGSIVGGFEKARQAILASIALLDDNAFVACGFAEAPDKILRFDTTTRSINGDFSLDGSTIYEVFTNAQSVGGSFSFSIEKNQVAAPIVATGAKIYIAIDAKVLVYSASNGNLIQTIDCGEASAIQGLAVSEEQQKVYGASLAGAVVVIDTGTDTLATILTATDDAAFGGENYAVAIDDTRDAAYITSRSTNKVLVLNTVTDSLTTTVNVGSKPEGIALSPTLGKAVVCNRSANTGSVIDTTNNTVNASIAMSDVGSGAEPTAVAIDENTGKAVVSLYAYHQVAIVDLATNEIEGRAATSPNPIEAKFVPSTGEIYVACEGGDITVIGVA